MADVLLPILTVTLLYISIIFLIAWKMARLDIIDIAWGGAFIVIALTSFSFGYQGSLQYLVTTLVLIWGFRISYYLFRRVTRASGEDPRYVEIRKKWKHNAALNAYLRIFTVQGALAVIISLPVIMINTSDQIIIEPIAVMGVGLWIIGFLFESIGDSQLRRHLADPRNKGKLMTSGLWKYTRHPNYFGEATQWWGIVVICLSVPFGWFGIVGALTITILLLFVSGVPLTEKRFEGRLGWVEYKKRTSVFVPWLPRK